MQAKRVNEIPGQRLYVLVFDKGDEFIATLRQFAEETGLQGSSFTAVGAFQHATLGYFDREKMDYHKIPIEEQVEVLSLVGNIALNEGHPKVHAHVVVGDRNGRAHGGHILQAYVWPTLELVVTETPRALQRHTDEKTGLALIDLTANGQTVRSV
ncbi:MAG: DNA-binding protein [Ardenticatenaceae bacterium]|nr:DNA-binding protein [Ardenticatenaceae bacterium]